MGIEPNSSYGRRRSGRLRAELAARFNTLSGIELLSICDLSLLGARLRPHGDTKVGTEGILTWLEYEAFGEVKWARGGFVGIEFEEPLSKQTLLDTRELFECGEAPDEERFEALQAQRWFQQYQQ